MEKKKERHLCKITLLSIFTIIFIGTIGLLLCKFLAPETFQNIIAPLHSFSSSTDEKIIDQVADTPTIDNIPSAESPVITEFTMYGNQELLTGGIVDIVYYNQSEEPWCNMSFGPDLIGGYGCGPTVMAMVISSLTSEIITPGDMAQWAYEHGYCAPGSGSYLSIVEGTASAFGLKTKKQEIHTPDELRLELGTGKLFVALMTEGHFTSSGHFILLRGVTLDGKILVADPNSRERSLATWDPQLLLDETKAKLWGISSLPQ